MAEGRPILVAAVAGAFGVKGLVRLKTFTAHPDAVTAYGPLCTDDGTRSFMATRAQAPRGDIAFVRLSGVDSREAAEALKGTRLFIERAALPELAEDDFYLADLIGMAAEDTRGTALGRVKAVHDFGAGDVLEVGHGKTARLFAFTREVVPLVDLAGGRVVIDPPPETEVGPEAGEAMDPASGDPE